MLIPPVSTRLQPGEKRALLNGARVTGDRPWLSVMCDTLVRLGHGRRAGQISGLQSCEFKACGNDELVDPPVQVAASTNDPPDRVEAVLPRMNLWVRRKTVLDEKQ